MKFVNHRGTAWDWTGKYQQLEASEGDYCTDHANERRALFPGFSSQFQIALQY